MLQDEIEEQLQTLAKQFEELRAEFETFKKEKANDEPTLIPGAEYDFVPSVPEMVIARGVAKFVGYAEAPKDLGLSPSEWAMFSDDEEEHG